MDVLIKLAKDGSMVRADLTNLPGSPRCGVGITEAHAVVDLFLGIMYQPIENEMLTRLLHDDNDWNIKIVKE
jgi:hypothetical protein